MFQDEIADAVTGLLDAGQSTQAAGAAAAIITTIARAYTRGRGFDEYGNPNDEIGAAITTAAARLAGNARQLNWSQTMGELSTDLRSAFTGWTLAEKYVLDRYRVRAM